MYHAVAVNMVQRLADLQHQIRIARSCGILPVLGDDLAQQPPRHPLHHDVGIVAIRRSANTFITPG